MFLSLFRKETSAVKQEKPLMAVNDALEVRDTIFGKIIFNNQINIFPFFELI